MPHIYVQAEPVEARRRHHHTRRQAASPDRQRHHKEHRRRIEPPEFRFCVELGLVLRSRRRDHETVWGLAAELSACFSREGIANHIASADGSTSRRLPAREWTIASELCIPSRPRNHRFGMKLVSPFMRFSRRPEAWQAELHTVMRVLNAYFELTTTHQCFTHVHLAPASGGSRWELGQAKAVAKSALYFERCLDSLVPPYRRRSVWAKSNRHNRYFAGLPMAECFARVDAQASLAGLALRMNLCAAESPTGRALRAAPGADFQHDAYRWSFAGLRDDGGSGTIAFRQPPGVTSAAEAVTWVMLVGCLARLSCGLGGSIEPANKAQLKSLGEWLLYEAEWCGMPHKGLLTDLVKQAVPVTVAPGVVAGADAEAITIDDDQRLRWKAKDWNVAAEKYRGLVADF